MLYAYRAVVAVGTGLALFGFAIYYLIPLSLLSLNLQLFINVFFWILMSALIGMVMIAMNVEILVEVKLMRTPFTQVKPSLFTCGCFSETAGEALAVLGAQGGCQPGCVQPDCASHQEQEDNGHVRTCVGVHCVHHRGSQPANPNRSVPSDAR
jgi:hypothetical protein